MEWKESVAAIQLLQGALNELRELAEHVQSLDFYSRPDYERVRRIFGKILGRFSADDTPMDWEPLIPDDCTDVAKQESEKSERAEDPEDGSGTSERGVNDVDG